MSQNLNRVRDVDDSDSDAVKAALSGFFQSLPKHRDIDCHQWLRGLENAINRYPKYCGTYRPVIENYVIHFLSSDNVYNVIMAAKCAHAAQQVRTAEGKGVTAKTCWRDLMATLCDTAHKLVDALFSKNAGMYSYKNNQKEKNKVLPNSTLLEAIAQLDSLKDNDGAVTKTTLLSTRLRNVLIFIQAMLVEVYPIAKPVQPQLILEVILQALSAPGIEDTDKIASIKIQALRTLDALVACLGSNLIPFSALVFRFVMQTLKWSSEITSEQTSKVRVAAYSSLSAWLHCLHVLCPTADGRARAWHDELTAHIIADVTPTKHYVQLTVNAQPMKNLSKKARKRLANNMLKESNIASHAPGDKNKKKLSDKTNEEVTIAALECAETFLSVCGLFLKTATHKQFQELLVRECFAIQDHTTDRALCLLHALEACRKSCSIKVPPPTQYCLQLYSVLINSPEREISKLCSQALLDIRLHLHCSPASLCYSLEEQTHKKKQKEEGRKRTSERNRAVLEKLLGIDWMNTEDPNTITIPDEPEAKRTRVTDANVVQTAMNVDEVTENVSISSDSVHSVEITSDSDDESIIEAVELPREPIDDDEIIFENEVTANRRGRNELAQDGFECLIHDEITQAHPIINDDEDQDDSVHDMDIAVVSWDGEEELADMEPNSQTDIHEARTQLLQNSDTIDGRRSTPSMEVGYDYPNTGNEKVPVLGNMDEDNLPSTNDTDDIPITCGQVIKTSLDVDAEINKDEAVVDEKASSDNANENAGTGKVNEKTGNDNQNGKEATDNVNEEAATGKANEKAATDYENEKTATDNGIEKAVTDDGNEKTANDNGNEKATSDSEKTGTEKAATDTANKEAATDNSNEKAATDNKNEEVATDNANEDEAMDTVNEEAATDNINEGAASENANEGAATSNNDPIKITFRRALTIRDMMVDFVDEVDEVILFN